MFVKENPDRKKKKKSKQLEEAVEWCQVNKKYGWAAINSGKFPLIKDLRTINK